MEPNRLTDNYIKWISDFNVDQFNNVVLSYIKYIWRLQQVSLCDGTNDGGNDLKFFIDNNRLKVQTQVTIQESNIKKKIDEDLKKALDNVSRFKYEARLFFFYSNPISEDKIKEYERDAISNYNIVLKIIDAKEIAGSAWDCIELRNCIKAQYGLPQESSIIVANDSDKAIYDLITFGSSTFEIKSQIVKSFLVHYIYENKISTKDIIYKAFEAKFEDTVSSNYIDRLINTLLTQKILFKQRGKDEYYLSDKESERISKVKEEFVYQEQKLYSDIKSLFNGEINNSDVDAIISKLKLIFENSFDQDYQEIIDKGDLIDYQKSHELLRSLYDLIFLKINEKNKTKEIIKEIFRICSKNDILQKLSAGNVYSKFVDNDQLQAYINQQDRFIYIDTQLALYALCVYYGAPHC